MVPLTDVRIYDRALSAEEIGFLYEAEAELPDQSVASAKLSPALSDLIDGNGSLEQALPAGSVIARKPGEDPPTGYTLFQRNEYNASSPLGREGTYFKHSTADNGMAVLNGEIYLVGGNGSEEIGKGVQKYNPMTNTWSTIASMNERRALVAAVAFNGKSFAIGGSGGGVTHASTEFYDPATQLWTYGPALPVATSGGYFPEWEGVLDGGV